MATSPSPSPPIRTFRPARPREPGDPAFKAVELAQRSRMILDVSATDLTAAEERYGPFHEVAWYFRQALLEAKRSWDRLRAEFGSAALEEALQEPPVTILTLGGGASGPMVVLIPIAGRTYGAERVVGTAPAPVIWRLTQLPPHEDGPYHVCRLADGSTQCDCAEWIYQIDGLSAAHCKHLAALSALRWI
ncbi:hypothetical protein BH23PLA1_BH23PLA1_11710 [soil metagenome]